MSKMVTEKKICAPFSGVAGVAEVWDWDQYIKRWERVEGSAEIPD